MKACIASLVLLVLACACGDRERDAGSTTPGGEGHRTAPVDPADLPFDGREAKQVLAALPGEDREVLERPDRLVLYALHPHPLVDGKLSPHEERLHTYGIIGAAEISEPQERRKLVEALYRGLLGEDAGPAQCFIPRHGVSAFRGSRRIDFVICFECTWVHVHGGSGAEGANRLLFSQSVSPVFDALFKKHGLTKHGE